MDILYELYIDVFKSSKEYLQSFFYTDDELVLLEIRCRSELFYLIESILEAFELANLRAELVIILFGLVALLNKLLLHTKLFVVHPLGLENELSEVWHFFESLDLIDVLQRGNRTFEERYSSHRLPLACLCHAEIDEVSSAHATRSKLIQLFVDVAVEPVLTWHTLNLLIFWIFLRHGCLLSWTFFWAIV